MKVCERFLKYVGIFSQSDENSGTHPSTEGQFDMADCLVNELRELGIEIARRDERCYVYAFVPASEGMEDREKIGLIAHMDTAPAFCGEGVRPRLIENYDGEDIALDSDGNIVMETSVFPELLNYKGQTLVVTDGTTLLGADDKAGIAEIMTALERIIKDRLPHPAVCVAFTPDEEIGEGADYFDVEGFGADYAYTVDGGALGELEYENFNAASARITVNGNCIHPGEGKNRMKNAVLTAMEFNSMLPPAEIPAHTEGYEGFYHITDIEGSEEKTVLRYIIRDHDRESFEDRKKAVRRIADFLNEKYGAGTVELELKDSYYNMKEKIAPRMDIVERARKAFLDNGVEPRTLPIRGGTDGARLSYMGLPCPNLSTGGHNFHGKFEYIPVESMEKMTDVLTALITG
ncbi:MAG: peptidase T [Butyrivibrio sp.]|nr:peptidase T [Butyrivibrio sp.]